MSHGLVSRPEIFPEVCEKGAALACNTEQFFKSETVLKELFLPGVDRWQDSTLGVGLVLGFV